MNFEAKVDMAVAMLKLVMALAEQAALAAADVLEDVEKLKRGS